MILFDKGDRISEERRIQQVPAEFHLSTKNAETVPDRADAAEALGKIKNDPAVVSALSEAARSDAFWGVRAEALRALGRLGGAEAANQIIASIGSSPPWVREIAVEQLGNFQGQMNSPPS